MTVDNNQLLDYLKRVTADLMATRRKLRSLEERTSEATSCSNLAQDRIAIVGIACHYPGNVDSADDLWRLVDEGQDVVGSLPEDRGWDLTVLGPQYGGFLRGAANFDPDFFGISPREALVMDPQQRLLLQTTWEALENAGVLPGDLAGQQVGVYLGSGFQDYEHVLGHAPEVAEAYMTTATSAAVLSGRVSYFYGFKGPSLTIDTACSSSLVSLHLAAEGLRGGECTLALAGGVMVMATPSPYVAFARQKGLAADGRCRSYSEEASGTGWSEGVGILVLERLEDARRNGHHVMGIVAGTAVNSDGASNGLTAPSGSAQQEVIKAACRDAGIGLADVQAVEGHGTGTVLGDPIEVQALLATYGQERSGDEPLWLGSIKSNIGHAQAAAGVAGVIKIVQAMRHDRLPRSLHCANPSTRVQWDSGRVCLLGESRPWPEVLVKRAGVSSFGISGTNAHVIVEEAPKDCALPIAGLDGSVGDDLGRVPLMLSAKSPAAVVELGLRLGEVLAEDEVTPAQMAAALASRTEYPWRLVVSGSDRDELINRLRGLAEPDVVQISSARPSIVVPDGQGWWESAGRSLRGQEAFDAAAQKLIACASEVPSLAGQVDQVRTWLADGAMVEDCELAELLVGVGLLMQVELLGAELGEVAGYGVGAVTAGIVSGTLTEDEAVRLLAGELPETSRPARLPLRLNGTPSQVWEQFILRRDAAQPDPEFIPELVLRSGMTAELVAALLWQLGGRVSLNQMLGDFGWPGKNVPNYPFQQDRYWLDMPRRSDAATLGLTSLGHPVLGGMTLIAGSDRALLMGSLSLASHPWLRDHRVGENVVFPGTGLVDLALRAAGQVGAVGLAELTITVPLIIGDSGVEVQVQVVGGPEGSVQVHSRAPHDGADWQLHAEGRLLATAPAVGRPEPRPESAVEHDVEELYSSLAAAGLNYGPQFSCVRRVWTQDENAWAVLELPSQGKVLAERFVMHPGLLDACAHVAMLTGRLEAADGVLLPFTWRTVTVAQQGFTHADVQVRVLDGNSIQITVWHPTRGFVAHVEALILRETDPSRLSAGRQWLYHVAWRSVDCETDGRLCPLYEVAPGNDLTAVRQELSRLLARLNALGDDDQLLVITRSGGVGTDLVGPAAWGLVRAAQLEMPQVDLRIADLGLADDAADLAGVPLSQFACYEGQISVPRLVLGSGAAPEDTAAELGAGPVLITGGTGALGGLVARHLAATGRAKHIVLLSRQGIDAAGARELVAEIEASGSRVTVVAADVADQEILNSLWQQHRPTAVFHLAGVSEDALLVDLTEDDLERAFAAKLGGALALDAVTREYGVETFVCFTSASGVLGAAGQASYAAANAAVEGVVAARRLAGFPAISMAWGLWDLGMSESLTDASRARLGRLGIKALNGAEGMELFDLALEKGASSVVPIHLEVGQVDATELPPILAELGRVKRDDVTFPQASNHLLEELRSLASELRHPLMLELVTDVVSQVLGHSGSIDPYAAFGDLGFDSLSAVEFRNALVQQTHVAVPSTIAFDYPNADAVAAYLLQELADQLSDQPDKPAVQISPREANEPIAIIGMGCHFAGGIDSPEDLWNAVLEERDTTSSFPTNRGWHLEQLVDPTGERPRTSITDRGHFLHWAGDVDPDFFGISPYEADIMDPQQFLLLETVWEALEHAGIRPDSLRNSATGVYAGLMYQDHVANSSTGAIFSGRVSYTLGLHGPSMTVDTACSSSLVALHLARRALQVGECDMALAGGVAVMGTPEVFVEFSRQGGLSRDGRCRSFGEGADGTGWGEGVGVLVLERLSDARRLGHRVFGVVVGSAVNSDGASNGLTAPSGPAQQRVIGDALRDAGLGFGDVDLIEGHGTGTRLGDPIEVGALLATYGRGRDSSGPVWLGSVKSNIGHVQAAAGVAGVIKVVQALRCGVMPASLFCEPASSQVDWGVGGVELLGSSRVWDGVGVRRGAVSSFGLSGTNAHVIVEQAPVDVAAPVPGVDPTHHTDAGELAEPVPLVISGSVSAAVDEMANALAERLDRGRDLFNVAGVLASRQPFSERLVLWPASCDEAIASLQMVASKAALPAGAIRGRVSGIGAQVTLAFTGQGSQWIGMGTGLMQYPAFAAVITEMIGTVDEALRWLNEDVDLGVTVTSADLVAQLHTWFSAGSPAAEQLPLTSLPVQLGLLMYEVALAAQLEAWGMTANLLVGHSIGEIAAATVAGILTRRDAIRLVVARGWLMDQCGGTGSMLAVQASEEGVRGWLDDLAINEDAGIAAVNAPSATVVSGRREAVERVAAFCEARGVRAVPLKVADGFHSVTMEPVLKRFAAVTGQLTYSQPTIRLISTVTGELDPGRLGEGMCSAQYWVDQIRSTVRFADAIAYAETQGSNLVIEVGPDAVLGPLTRQALPEVATVSLGRRGCKDSSTLNKGIASAWVHGAVVDWQSFLGPSDWPMLDVPTYRFQRTRHWSDASEYAATSLWLDLPAGTPERHGLESVDHAVLTSHLVLQNGEELFMGQLSPKEQPWLRDHEVLGAVLYPGSGLVELVIAAGIRVGYPALKELVIQSPLVFQEGDVRTVMVVVAVAEGGVRLVRVLSRHEGFEWISHAEGQLVQGKAEPVAMPEWKLREDQELEVEKGYERLAERGFAYGLAFRALRRAWASSDGSTGEVELSTIVDEEGYVIHPALLDAAMHPALIAGAGGDHATLPFVWNDVTVHQSGVRRGVTQIIQPREDSLSLRFLDEFGLPVVEVGAVTGRVVSEPQLRGSMEDLYVTNWELVGSLPTGRMDSAVHVVVADSAKTAQPAATAEVLERVLAKIQAFLADPHAPECCVVLTSGAYRFGSMACCPEQRAVWGLVRAAEAENPGRFVLVDVEEMPGVGERQQLSAILAGVGEAELALRGDQLWRPRLVLAEPGEGEGAGSVRGTVLVTGGTSGIGAVLARHLASRHEVTELVLVSRRGAEAPGAEELLTELAAFGVAARAVACDMSDRDKVFHLVESLPELDVVLHCAGVADNCLVTDLTLERLRQVLAPKAAALWWLHEATMSRDLSAFIAMSSAGGMVLAAGQGNYAAANLFVDGLMELRRAAALPGISLAYGLWDLSTGMTYDVELASSRMASLGFPAISPARAKELFDAALSLDEATVVPLVIDRPVLRARREVLSSLLLSIVPSPAQKASFFVDAAQSWRERLAVLEDEKATEQLELMVRQCVAGVLGHASADAIAPDRPFEEFGFDSLSAVELRNQLGRIVEIDLPATLVFDYPNVRAVARHIFKELSDEAVSEADVLTNFIRTSQEDDEVVAIVGMGCHYPGGVDSPAELWQLVSEGREGVGPVPTDRGWDMTIFDPAGGPGKSYVAHGGFLQGAAEFDPIFFGIAANDALLMDPQQRVLLETAWEALEDANIDPLSLRGTRTGVWTGVMYHDYAFGADAAAASGGSLVSGRLSYFLGAEGPSLSVDTACSSSLVALHLARRSLLAGECDLALAGGVAIMGTPGMMVEFSRQRGLSPDGRCRSYSEAANGTGWSEGAGVVVLERLSDARRLGHRVLAVMQGSAVNSDGASNGFSAPNGPSQQRVINQALADAGVTASEVDLLEGHGTATKLGDPIEAQAVIATYGQRRNADKPLWLGSIKSNIGHTQAASGVAGVIKAVQAVRHAWLPRSLHAEHPSSKVDWSAGNVRLLTEGREWVSAAARCAAVSSFGISGTNAHVIITESREDQSGNGSVPSVGPVPLVLSAKVPAALAEQASRIADALSGGMDLAGTAATLARRAQLSERLVVIATGVEDAVEQLRQFSAGQGASLAGRVPTVVTPPAPWWFGNDPAWGHQAWRLLSTDPVWRAEWEAVLAELPEELYELRPDPAISDDPGLFVAQLATARLLLALGVRHGEMSGWGIGEATVEVLRGSRPLLEVVQDLPQVIGGRLQAEPGSLYFAPADVEAADAGCPVLGDAGLLDCLAKLWLAGEKVAWGDVVGAHVLPTEGVPTYPFQNERYWVPPVAMNKDASSLGHAVLVHRWETTENGSLTYTGILSQEYPKWTQGHRVAGVVWYPGAGLVDLALWAGSQVGLSELQEFTLLAPLVLDQQREVQVNLDHSDSSCTGVTVRSRAGAGQEWVLHAEGIFSSREPVWSFGDAGSARPDGPEVPVDMLYNFLEGRGLEYGDSFRGVRRVWREADGLLAQVVLPEGVDSQGHLIHPALLDACLHALALGGVDSMTEPPKGALVPFVWRGVQVFGVVPREVYARLSSASDASSGVRLALFAADGRLVAAVDCLTLREVDRAEASVHGMAWIPMEEPSVSTIEPVVVSPLLPDRVSPHRWTPDASAWSSGWTGAIIVVPSEGQLPQSGRSAVEWVLEQLHQLLQHDIPVAVVTRQVWSLDDRDELVNMTGAGVWGLVRAAQAEYPGRIVLVDVGRETDLSRVAGVLGGQQPEVAIRERMSFPRLRPLPRNKQVDRPLGVGTVLFTGGTGGVGGLLALHAVERLGVSSVVLASRSGSQAAHCAELVRKLESLGARVQVVRCDVAHREQVMRLIEGIQDLSAVVHCAGDSANGLVADLGIADIGAAWQAKADGAWWLHEATFGKDLEAFVLVSSAGGQLLPAGQGAYAAANTWLDILASYRQKMGLPGIAIAYGLWDVPTGLSSRLTEQDKKRIAHKGFPALSLDEVLAMTDVALASDEAMVTVARLDRSRLHGLDVPALVRDSVTGRLSVDENSQALQLGEWDALDLVRRTVAEVLGHPAEVLDMDLGALEQGIDSLGAVDIRNRLRERSGVDLSPTIAFDAGSLREIAELLEAGRLTNDGVAVAGAASEPAGHTMTSASFAEPSVHDLFAQALREGRTEEGMALLRSIAALRPKFGEGARIALPVLRYPVNGQGSGFDLICVSTPTVAGGVHQFAQMARHLDASVVALPVPGFRSSEDLPDCFAAAIGVLADAVASAADASRSYVLLGFSSGGLLAHAVAAELERRAKLSQESGPAGLVLLDTYQLAHQVNDAIFNQMAVALDNKAATMGAFSSGELSAMGHFVSLLRDFAPAKIESPVLFVQANDWFRKEEPPIADWRPSWEAAKVVRLPGSHFTLIEGDAASTAAAINNWIGGLPRGHRASDGAD